MGFAELAKADAEFILGGDFAELEGIEYQEVTKAGALPWKVITHAIVERGDPSAPLELGNLGRRGQDPIQVSISKDATIGIAEVHPQQDVVKLNPGMAEERLYKVVAILDAGDPAIWRLYAVA